MEVTGALRQDGLARLAKMYRVPPTGPSWPAVASPVDRLVRRRICGAAQASPERASPARLADADIRAATETQAALACTQHLNLRADRAARLTLVECLCSLTSEHNIRVLSCIAFGFDWLPDGGTATRAAPA